MIHKPNNHNKKTTSALHNGHRRKKENKIVSTAVDKIKSILPKGKWTKQRVMLYAGIGLIGMMVIGYVLSFALFAWFARDLPSPGKLSQGSGATTVFYDRNDKPIYQLYEDKNRVPVDFEDISQHLKDATVAIEDKSFYSHKGISQTGIIRALYSNIFRGEVQGASTITQQVIKNVLLSSERTLPRKIKEAILTAEVEKRYTKDEILGIYLNEVPYGGTFYGVGSAAKGYFNKEPKNLNLLESAILAGLPQSPSRYSPFIGTKDAWKGRTKDVLRRMAEDEYITEEQQTKALKELDKYKFEQQELSIDAPHFVFFVQRFLQEEFGDKILDRGLEVKTTLNLNIQRAAQDIIKEEIESLDEYNVSNGASIVLDSETNEILAHVGSYDFNNADYGKFDVATDPEALRQPGSTLKPIAFALAFEKGYTPSTVIMDVPTDFGNDYTPVNYDGTFRGPVQARFALANSYNIPAVKILGMVGLKDFLGLANDMGLETLAPSEKNLSRLGLSAVLGGGEVHLLDLTEAYSVFARGGTKKELIFIEEVKDFSGKVLYKRPNQNEKRVLSEETSFLISHILSDDAARADAFGTGSMLNIPNKTVAVKTGTTDDKRDNWAVGFSKGVTVGVWVGNNDNEKMNPQIASGTTGATSIWNDVMKTALKENDDGIIEKPSGVEAMEIDAYLGGLPKEGYPTRSEYFIKGTEPKDVATFYKKLKINGDKLANEVQIKAGNYEEKEYIVLKEKDPISTDGRNRWQEGIDAWIQEQDDEKLKPPTETSDGSAEDVVVSMKSPNDTQKIEGNKVEVKAKIVSVHNIKEVRILANGEEKRKIHDNIEDLSETIELDDGTYEIKVVAKNDKDKEGESSVRIGVNRDWNEADKPEEEEQPEEEKPTIPPFKQEEPPAEEPAVPDTQDNGDGEEISPEQNEPPPVENEEQPQDEGDENDTTGE
jgi:1A family penicillin-binding protein